MGGGFGDQNNQDTLNVQNSLFLNNVSGNGGGGIYFSGTTGAIMRTQIMDNSTGGAGGGLFVGGPQTSTGTPTGTTATVLTLTASTLADNVAAVGGGGIELETTAKGSAITTSTITGNIALNNAGANGGGIDAPTTFTDSVALLNDTLNANFAANGGGIFWGGIGIFALRNTIVAQNVIALGGVGPDLDGSGTAFTDLGGNLIGLAGSANGNTGLGLAFGGLASTQVGTTTALNPLLLPLGYYGGPILGAIGHQMGLESEPPMFGSPALFKGAPYMNPTLVLGGPIEVPTTNELGTPKPLFSKINVGAV